MESLDSQRNSGRRKVANLKVDLRQGALGRFVAVAMVVAALCGCAFVPSQGDLDQIKTALDSAEIADGELYVSSEQNSGFGNYVSVIIAIREENFTVDTLREVLRILYDNTPDGYRPQFRVSFAEPDPTDKFGIGELHLLRDFLEELGLPHPTDFSYYFTRAELDALFD